MGKSGKTCRVGYLPLVFAVAIKATEHCLTPTHWVKVKPAHTEAVLSHGQRAIVV